MVRNHFKKVLSIQNQLKKSTDKVILLDLDLNSKPSGFVVNGKNYPYKPSMVDLLIILNGYFDELNLILIERYMILFVKEASTCLTYFLKKTLNMVSDYYLNLRGNITF
jgi:hypothetical protein